MNEMSKFSLVSSLDLLPFLPELGLGGVREKTPGRRMKRNENETLVSSSLWLFIFE